MKNSRSLFYVIVIVILILAILAAAIVWFGKRGTDTTESIELVSQTPSPLTSFEKADSGTFETQTTINTEILTDGLRNMGVLVTSEYYFTEAVNFSKVKKLLNTEIELHFTEASYLATYDGVVTAGLDFTAVTVEVDDEAKTLTVTLPAATIQNVDIDPDSFVLYSEKDGVGNHLTASDFNSSLQNLETTARAKAIDKGLLEQADEQARSIVTSFLNSCMEPNDYSIIVVEKGA